MKNLTTLTSDARVIGGPIPKDQIVQGIISFEDGRIKIQSKDQIVCDLTLSDIKKVGIQFGQISFHTDKGTFGVDLNIPDKKDEQRGQEAYAWKQILEQSGVKMGYGTSRSFKIIMTLVALPFLWIAYIVVHSLLTQ